MLSRLSALLKNLVLMSEKAASCTNVSQGRQTVKQLQAEAGLERMKVSKAASDLLQYCLEQAKNDPLLTGIPASSNPFKEKRMCTIA